MKGTGMIQMPVMASAKGEAEEKAEEEAVERKAAAKAALWQSQKLQCQVAQSVPGPAMLTRPVQ